jgi:hypothetical protein
MALTRHRQTPNRSREQRERCWALVEQALAGRVICGRCKATLATFDDACTADLDDACPGFVTLDKAKSAAERKVGLQ